MNDSSDPTKDFEDFDQILAQFHAELEHGEDPEAVIKDFQARYPDRGKEFRDAARMRHILDSSAEDVDDYRPEQLGDFRIVREISHGGMKIIYEAIQEPLNRRVAVATIRKGRLLSPYRERFLREQEVLATLHQTNIVPVFAAGEDGPIQYFAMPYIEGATLSHVVTAAWNRRSKDSGGKTPPLSQLAQVTLQEGGSTQAESLTQTEEEAADKLAKSSSGKDMAEEPIRLSREYFDSVAHVMANVADSLQHAHEHGFFHRDLKPANIMVDRAEQCWLIDFGLAGCVEASAHMRSSMQTGKEPLTQTNEVMGTPGYMAPEQKAGGPTDERTDVWGLGITLYELITLRRAFPRHGQDDDHSSNGLESPRKMVDGLPRDLEAICLKALRVAPTIDTKARELLEKT